MIWVVIAAVAIILLIVFRVRQSKRNRAEIIREILDTAKEVTVRDKDNKLASDSIALSIKAASQNYSSKDFISTSELLIHYEKLIGELEKVIEKDNSELEKRLTSQLSKIKDD
ncbi:hypothetical protein [Vibrio parahaemolyticus]|uniref:hypothetical protein n=1 Tax=Vibrio parahaemolyticus TaxID=670 RepID=UPI001FAB7BB5|nr:hypothetical protein [Vibrio parahaemolyticus]MCI9705797.1 hypothetical protein [Vibrio parahaemolyticus]MDF5481238.1 hypothetical protein [Vibrio parahaemolyticus]MDG2837105.1 hypothetical protein [Vibrio parahaemolyticus]